MGLEITVNSAPIRNLADTLGPDVQRILEEVGDFIKERARQLAPVLTGQLRDSIDVLVQEWGVLVVAGVDYAQFVEYGKINTAAHPFLTPAIQEGAALLEKKLTDLFRSTGR